MTMRGILCLLPIFLASAASSTFADEATKKRVEREYPAAAQKLDDRYNAMHGKAAYRSFTDYPGEPHRTTDIHLEFAYAPGSAMMSSTRDKVPDRAKETEKTVYRRVIAQNPKYWFELKNRHPDDDLAITATGDDPRRGLGEILNFYGIKVQCAITGGYGPFTIPMKRGTFRVDDAVQGFDGDPKKVLIRYTIVRNPGGEHPRNPIINDGWLVVSPDEGWIIHDYNAIFTQSRPKSNVGHIDYARSPDGHLDPVKVSEKMYEGRIEKGHEGKAMTGYDIEFQGVTYQAPPESSFRLPAFGLPEIEPAGKGASVDKPYGLFAASAAGFGIAPRSNLANLSAHRPGPFAAIAACSALLASPAVADDPAPAKDQARPAAKVSVKADEPDPARPRPVSPAGFRVDVADAPVGEPASAEVEIRNTGNEPIRLLGSSYDLSMTGMARVSTAGKYPRTIAAGQSAQVEVLITPYKAAQKVETLPVDAAVDLYVGASTTFAVPIRVRAAFVASPPADTPSRADPR